ncbi:MAG: AAA family ATPase [Acidobacteriota bacterium]
MIHVDRDRHEPPKFLQSDDYRTLVEEFERFHLAGGSRKQQQRSHGEELLKRHRDDAIQALLQVFHGKCAYSEVPVGPRAELVLHRPPADALDEKGDVAPDHYWWLATQWSNWYPALERVAHSKQRMFPVVGERSPVPTTIDELPPLDRGVLLDPCVDEPSWWLRFDDDGEVHPRRPPSSRLRELFAPLDRGRTTIAVCDLNSERLIASRRRSLGTISSKEPGPLSWWDLSDELLERARDPWSGFTGAFRQRVARALVVGLGNPLDRNERTLVQDLAAEFVVELAPELLELAANVPPEPARDLFAPVFDYLEEHHPDVAEEHPMLNRDSHAAGSAPLGATASAAPPMESEAARESEPRKRAAESALVEPKETVAIWRTARLLRARVKNFKAIRDVTLELSDEPVVLAPRYGDPEHEELRAMGWKSLLGENGSGKSSLLEAIGLALAGQHLERVLGENRLSWKRLLRRGTGSKKVRQGRIALDFSGDVSIDLRFNDRKHWWQGPEPDMQVFVRGYGATRLLQSEDDERRTAHGTVSIANLYDPRAPVIDAERWLLGLDEGDFNAVAITLADLLQGDAPGVQSTASPDPGREPLIVRDEDEIVVGGDPLALVSDGYRAVIAIVCDILQGLGTGLSEMRHANGIVLIDEIGAHLHPRWRMAITNKLRRALPGVQFLVSTHEPLCLRGLVKREVVRVRKSPETGVTVEEVERSPSDYRVDQLLTSEFFGLETTIDPDLDRRFQAYYRLLSVPEEERSDEQADELRRLRTYIQQNSQPALGHTRRDQLVYEAIDEFIKDQESLSPEERRRRRRGTLDRVREIWEARKTLFPSATDDS